LYDIYVSVVIYQSASNAVEAEIASLEGERGANHDVDEREEKEGRSGDLLLRSVLLHGRRERDA
jgi:hypothetical protein